MHLYNHKGDTKENHKELKEKLSKACTINKCIYNEKDISIFSNLSIAQFSIAQNIKKAVAPEVKKKVELKSKNKNEKITSYYDSGEIKAEESYKKDLKNGTWTE